MDASEIQDFSVKLSQDWGLMPGNDLTEENLKKLLGQALLPLIRQNPERLLFVMYRLDIPEGKFHQAMQEPSPESAAEKLADLIWERELLRMRIWKKYSKPE